MDAPPKRVESSEHTEGGNGRVGGQTWDRWWFLPAPFRLPSPKDAMAWTLWWQRGGRLPRVTCFFCNQGSYVLAKDGVVAQGQSGSSISQGTLQQWTCCHCTARNVLDDNEPRGISSWEQSMSNESSFSPLAQPRRHLMQSSTLEPQEAHSLLCRRCLTNLRIQTALLADQDTATEAQAMRHRLDERYPVLCEGCKPGVDSRIFARNNDAKREIWRSKMDHRRRAAANRPPSHSNIPPTAALDSPRARSTLIGVARLQNALSLLCFVVSWAFPSAPHAWPDPTWLLATQTLFHITFTRLVLDDARYFAQRDDILDDPLECHLAEQSRLRRLAWSSWGLSIFYTGAKMTLQPAMPSFAAHAWRWLSLAGVIVQTYTLASRRSSITAAPTVRAEPVAAAPLGDPPAAAPSTETDSNLSAHLATTPVFGLASSSAHPQTAPLRADAMDWQPSEPLRDDDNEPDPIITYPRQRFFAPEQPTGLELLLSKRLTLEDRSIDAGPLAPAQGNETIRRAWEWSFVVVMATIVLAALQLT